MAEHGHSVALMGAWGVEPHACHFSGVWLVAAIGEQREGAGCKNKIRVDYIKRGCERPRYEQGKNKVRTRNADEGDDADEGEGRTTHRAQGAQPAEARAREHEGTGPRGHVARPGYFVPAGPGSADHHMQRATIIRGPAARASRVGTGRAVTIGPRRRLQIQRSATREAATANTHASDCV